MSLIYDDKVCKWVSRQIFKQDHLFDDKCVGIGVALNGKVIAGVVYSNFMLRPDGSPLSIEMSVASTDRRWCTKQNLRAFFAYPFIELGLKRVQTTCSAERPEIIDFNHRLGFVEEGEHREAWPLGGNAISFSMLNNECRWING